MKKMYLFVSVLILICVMLPGFASADYGYTTAIGLFRSLVGLGLMLICNYASKKVRGRGIV